MSEEQVESTGSEVEVEQESTPTKEETTKQAEESTESAETPTYTPNYQFKVKDKSLEFDEWVRPVIKDADTEKKLRDLYEKAYGLDEVKASRDNFKTQYESLNKEWSPIKDTLTQLNKLAEKGDYNSFFQALGVPKEQIIRYAIDELKYQELPSEQKQAIDAYREQQQYLMQLEQQNQMMLTQQQQMVRMQKESELSSVMTRPEVVTIAQQYDARAGKPGAFRDEVIKRGAYYEQFYNQTITADQAVQEVLNIMGGIQPATPAVVPQTGQGQATVVQQKTVLPNMQARGGTSPAKKQPVSIEDLRKLRKQMTTDVNY